MLCVLHQMEYFQTSHSISHLFGSKSGIDSSTSCGRPASTIMPTAEMQKLGSQSREAALPLAAAELVTRWQVSTWSWLVILIATYNTPSMLEDICKTSLRACRFKHCHVEGTFSSKVTCLNDKKYHPLCTRNHQCPHSTHPEQFCHLIQTTGVQRQQWHEEIPAEAWSPLSWTAQILQETRSEWFVFKELLIKYLFNT